MKFTYRKASLSDVSALEQLIQQSAETINTGFYSDREIQAALAEVWTVDAQLIKDNTYWIVENTNGMAVGCGGWSDRKLFYGRHHEDEAELEEKLVPGVDSARIRAFFVHQDYTRKGIGSALLQKCEEEAREHGFDSCELVATLSGEKLYESRGYLVVSEHEIDLGNNMTNKVVSMFKKLGRKEERLAARKKNLIRSLMLLATLLFVLYKLGVMDGLA